MTEKRLKEDPIKVCTKLKGECKDHEIRCFSEVSNDRIRGNEQKLKQRKLLPFWEPITKKAQKDCRILVLLDQKPFWTCVLEIWSR